MKFAGVLSQASKKAWGAQEQEQDEPMECKEEEQRATKSSQAVWRRQESPGWLLALVFVLRKHSQRSCTIPLWHSHETKALQRERIPFWSPTRKECKCFYTSNRSRPWTSWMENTNPAAQTGVKDRISCEALKKHFTQQELVLDAGGSHGTIIMPVPGHSRVVKTCSKSCCI